VLTVVIPRSIQAAFLTEKLATMVDAVDRMVEDTPVRPPVKSTGVVVDEASVIETAERIDSLRRVYGAAYRLTGGELILISERQCEDEDEDSLFDPFNFSAFTDVMYEIDSGTVAVTYAPDGQPETDAYVYYCWLPQVMPPPDGACLVMVGVSGYSLLSPASARLSAVLLAAVLIAAVPVVWVCYITSGITRVSDNKGGGAGDGGGADAGVHC